MDPVIKFKTIVNGTQNALEFAVKSKIKKNLFLPVAGSCLW